MKKRNKLIALAVTLLLALQVCLPIQAADEPVETADDARATKEDVVTPSYNNKKGIQGLDLWFDGTDSEFKDSVNHVYFNVYLNDLINTNGTGTKYTYNGKDYYYNYNYIHAFEEQAAKLRAQGKALTFEVYMRWTDDAEIQKLIYPNARQSGYYCYALNVDDPESRETISAAYHYLMDVFGKSECFVQNWIVGNEVNLDLYNHTGETNVYKIVRNYALTYDLMYQAQQELNPNAKVYTCLTHLWNYESPAVVATTKDFIDLFASMETDKDWNLALHAYPAKMTSNMWSRASAELAVNNIKTTVIDAANLNVMTDYIKDTYGSEHRIILSEQGFDSASCGEEAQAAAIAYLYHAAARNDMIDAVIYTVARDYAPGSFGDEYEHMGLVDRNGHYKQSYNVFKYMNTDKASTYVDKYMQYITPNDAGRSIQSWSDSIIWQAEPTGAVMTGALAYAEPQQNGTSVWMGMSGVTASENVPLEYHWLAYDLGTKEWIEVVPWRVCDNPSATSYSYSWYPEKRGSYMIVGEVRVAGNPSSVVQTNAMTVEMSTGLPFVDVRGTDWFYTSVKSVYDLGIMTGKTPEIFGPTEDLARAQFAVMIYRLAGSPAVEYSDRFSDVSANTWYTDAVIWASDAGVITGYSDSGKFGPSDPINREQMATMMYRYARYKGYSISEKNDLSSYPDKGSVSEFAEEGMQWAVGCGLITGNNGKLDPQGSAVRAQTATIVKRFVYRNKI